MMGTQNTEQMLSRPGLKRFVWLGLFVFQLNSTSIVQMTDVKAKVGEVARLPCENYRDFDKPLQPFTVYWQKEVYSDIDEVALSYYEGKEDVKAEKYCDRTKMDKQNLTLWISPVEVSDRGQYKCVIQNSITNTWITLSVVADFSKPVIHVDVPRNACGSTLVTLNCSSHGGYPEPSMSGFLNTEKVDWTPTSVSDNKTELFTITGYLQLNVTGDAMFQCSVLYPDFQISSIYKFTIPKECPVEKPIPLWIVIASIVALACLVVVIVLANIYCCRRQGSLCYTSSCQSAASNGIRPDTVLTLLQPPRGASEA